MEEPQAVYSGPIVYRAWWLYEGGSRNSSQPCLYYLLSYHTSPGYPPRTDRKRSHHRNVSGAPRLFISLSIVSTYENLATREILEYRKHVANKRKISAVMATTVDNVRTYVPPHVGAPVQCWLKILSPPDQTYVGLCFTLLLD
jgi:hypothetical protein